MASVIKADQQAAAGAPMPHTAFNFDDLTRKANAYLESVRKAAQEIIARAEQDAAQIKKAAEVEGREAAVRQAEKAVEARIDQKLKSALPALESAAAHVRQSKDEWAQAASRTTLELALAIARRIVRRELRAHQDITLAWVSEALELAGDSDRIVVHLSPQDHQALGEQVRQIGARLGKLARADVVADPEVTAGGCLVQTRFGTIDQRLETQLARFEEELQS
jgi:flagellar assembly protein FliH